VIRSQARALVVGMPGLSDHRAVLATFPGGPTVASWNMGDGPDVRKAAGLDRLAHHGADVICLQEAADRVQVIARWAAASGWDVWAGDGRPGAASVPILWRASVLEVVTEGSRTATPAQWIGAAGAGPARAKAKVINRVRVRPRR
jgi:exonuclease III